MWFKRNPHEERLIKVLRESGLSRREAKKELEAGRKRLEQLHKRLFGE